MKLLYIHVTTPLYIEADVIGDEDEIISDVTASTGVGTLGVAVNDDVENSKEKTADVL